TLAAATARPAPEHVRAATLAAVAATPQVGTGAAAAGAVDLASERVRRRRAPVRTALVAAVAAAVLAVPVTVAWRQADRAAVAEQRLAAVERLLGAPDARLVAADVAGGGRAVAVVTDDVALVTASGVSDPGSDRVYQLWLLRDGAALPSSTSPVTAGGFDVTTAEFRPGDALAVTVEPRGGSTAPTTDPVVVLEPA
ncbi:anti-sigma factor, partial [Cellulomonas iranensis]